MHQDRSWGDPLAAGAMAALALILPELVAPSASIAIAQVKTMKERLSDKAADEQRVNNCRVPVERRGSTLRLGCPGEAQPAAPSK